MKRLHKRQRIFILLLLCFSVFAPIVLVSYRLRAVFVEGDKGFVEDLSSIKYKADSLKLTAIQQEEAEVKEPKQEVYREQRFSNIRDSSDENSKVTRSDTESIKTSSLERKGTNHHLKEEYLQLQQKKAPPSRSNRERVVLPRKSKYVSCKL